MSTACSVSAQIRGSAAGRLAAAGVLSASACTGLLAMSALPTTVNTHVALTRAAAGNEALAFVDPALVGIASELERRHAITLHEMITVFHALDRDVDGRQVLLDFLERARQRRRRQARRPGPRA